MASQQALRSALLVTLASIAGLSLLAGGGAADNFSDTISEDDVIFYVLEVGPSVGELSVVISWEDWEDDLDLYLLGPGGTYVADSLDVEGTTEDIVHEVNETGSYTLGVYAWDVHRSASYTGSCNCPVTKVTRSFGGTLSDGDVLEYSVDVHTASRPVFVRVSWDSALDDINITLKDPFLVERGEPDNFWGFDNALFFLLPVNETGTYTLTVEGLDINSGEEVTFTATCNFPISGGDEDGTSVWVYVAIPLAVVIAVVGIAGGFYVARGRRGRFSVEEVFLVYPDGRLIINRSRSGFAQDADLMSGMLVAIQGFVEEGLYSGGALESIKYGDSVLLLARGRTSVLVARVLGTPSEVLTDHLRRAVSEVEAVYGQQLHGWTGDRSALSGIERFLDPLLSLRS